MLENNRLFVREKESFVLKNNRYFLYISLDRLFPTTLVDEDMMKDYEGGVYSQIIGFYLEVY